MDRTPADAERGPRRARRAREPPSCAACASARPPGATSSTSCSASRRTPRVGQAHAVADAVEDAVRAALGSRRRRARGAGRARGRAARARDRRGARRCPRCARSTTCARAGRPRHELTLTSSSRATSRRRRTTWPSARGDDRGAVPELARSTSTSSRSPPTDWTPAPPATTRPIERAAVEETVRGITGARPASCSSATPSAGWSRWSRSRCRASSRSARPPPRGPERGGRARALPGAWRTYRPHRAARRASTDAVNAGRRERTCGATGVDGDIRRQRR